MYTRSGCHLCETAWIELLEAEKRHGFALSAVDVDEDPELTARFGDEVPVITLNGKVRFRGGLNRALLNRLLDAERRQR
jgi:glutaredoxin